MAGIEIPINALEEANKLFDKYDLNKNNSIEFEELKSLMHDLAADLGLPIPSDEDIDQVMDDTDINRDKRISRDEFVLLFKIIYTMKFLNSKEK